MDFVDVYYHIGERLKLEGETEGMGVSKGVMMLMTAFGRERRCLDERDGWVL